jgi:phosphohistidine phosphatase
MSDIIFWRHAEAFDAIEGQCDLDRKLTVKGQRNAERVGHWLDRNLPQRCRVFASEAKRSQQTAHCLPRKFKTLAAINPEASADAVFAAIDFDAIDDTIVLVGHQPWIGASIARMLAIDDIDAFSVRKGAVWWLQRRTREGETSVVIRAVVAPDLL